MMRLPVLTPGERAHLRALLPDGAMQAFARRLRQHLVASLGVPSGVRALPADAPAARPAASEPLILIEPALAAAWLAVRLGGKARAADVPPKDARLTEPFQALIRRALAETVLNLGEAAWPQALHLQVAIGPQPGKVEIVWDGTRAQAWARRAIGGKT